MKNAFYFILMIVFCGCLSSAPTASKKWYVTGIKGEMSEIFALRKPSVKISRVSVRPPYDGTSLAVLRTDGSIAFDPCNAFASNPERLLSGAVFDALESSGFADVVLDSKSSIPSPLKLEVTVTRLALDCRMKGRRDASVGVILRLCESGKVLSVSRGESTAPTGEADYTKSFSTAFTRAMSEALKRL